MAALGSPLQTFRGLLRELRHASGRPYRDTPAYQHIVATFRAHRVRSVSPQRPLPVPAEARRRRPRGLGVKVKPHGGLFPSLSAGHQPEAVPGPAGAALPGRHLPLPAPQRAGAHGPPPGVPRQGGALARGGRRPGGLQVASAAWRERLKDDSRRVTYLFPINKTPEKLLKLDFLDCALCGF